MIEICFVLWLTQREEFEAIIKVSSFRNVIPFPTATGALVVVEFTVSYPGRS
jgi:hypothetical protein